MPPTPPKKKKSGAGKAPRRREKLTPLGRKARAQPDLTAPTSLFSHTLEFSNEEGAEMLRRMFRIRHFEERLFQLVAKKKIAGTAHVYSGQEAVAVGGCAVLRPDDYMTSTHRGHGHAIARGASLKQLLAEVAGKASGYCRGKGGSMHVADVKHGNLGATGIVGGNIPIAVGAGIACQLNKRQQIVLCFFGDGAANTGAFHEALNLAAIWNLPVVFLCENNQFAMSLPAKNAMKGTIHGRAANYGIEGVSCDGMHLLEVREAVTNAAERARSGAGPTLIEAVTYRYRGHAGEDESYRSAKELAEWKARDPIDLFRIVLAEGDAVLPNAAEKIEQEVMAEVEEAVTFALESADPDAKEVLTDVYKRWVEGPLGLELKVTI